MAEEEKKELTEKEKFAVIQRLSDKLDKENKTTNSLVFLGGKKKKIMPIPCIPMGFPSLDYEAIQFGGVPKGRVIEIFGPESSGKTTSTLQLIAAAQQQGVLCAFVDAEHALDPIYAEKLGVDLEKLIFTQPNSGEQALQIVRDLVNTGIVGLIVVDSVAGLVPEAELAGDIGDAHVGLQARLMSQSLRILTGEVSRSQTVLVFINQIREKIGVMYGNPETTPGGRALKFYSSLRIKVRRGEAIWEGTKDNIVGHKLIYRIEKNKGGIPFRTAELDLMYPGEGRQAGLDRINDVIAYSAKHGLFETRGSWFWLDLGNKDEKGKPVGPERIANGLDNLKTELRGNQSVIAALEKKIAAYVKEIAEEPVANIAAKAI